MDFCFPCTDNMPRSIVSAAQKLASLVELFGGTCDQIYDHLI